MSEVSTHASLLERTRWRLQELVPRVADRLRGPVSWLGPLRRWRIPLYAVRGAAVDGSPSMLIAGRHRTLSYLQRQFVGDDASVEPLGSVPLLSLPRTLERLGGQFDLFAAAVDRPVARWLFGDRCLLLPEVIDAALPVPPAGEPVRWPKNAKENARRVRSRGFTWSFSTRMEDFNDFFERMCVPYAVKRHAGLVYYPDRVGLRERFRHGGLMLIAHEGAAVAGGVFAVEGDVLRGQTLGAVDGSEELLRLGVLNGLYVFGAELAQQRGLNWYNLGASAPFLGDGPLYHKLSWGAVLRRRRGSHRNIAIGWPRYNDHIARLLADTMPIFRDGDGYSALMVPRTPADADVATVHRRYGSIGLERVVLAGEPEGGVGDQADAGGDWPLLWCAEPGEATAMLAGATPWPSGVV